MPASAPLKLWRFCTAAARLLKGSRSVKFWKVVSAFVVAFEETFALIEVLLLVETFDGVDVIFAMKTCLWP